MLSTITKRLDDWGHLSLLESFIRRTEIQAAIRIMTNDLRITAEKLQVMPFIRVMLPQTHQTKS